MRIKVTQALLFIHLDDAKPPQDTLGGAEISGACSQSVVCMFSDQVPESVEID